MAGGFGKELLFTLDNFQQVGALSMKESIARVIMNIFTLRPGNLPSMPNIGMDLDARFMYKTDTELDVNELRKDLYEQCQTLLSFITLGEVSIIPTEYKGSQMLIITIPITGIGEGEETLVMGFNRDETGSLNSSFQYQNNQV